jgi:hypothetical protein
MREAASDWIDRLYASTPAPAWAVGVGIAALLLALFAALSAATGELAEYLARGGSILRHRNARLGLVLPLLVAYAPTAQRQLALASRRNLESLRRATGVTAQEAPLAGLGLTIAAALLCLPLTALAIDRDPLLYFRPSYWGSGPFFNWLYGGLLCAVLGRFAHATARWARTFSQAARRLPEVDLFERAWLAPFANQGLLCALLWLVVPALFAVNLGDAAFQLVVPPLGLACLAIGSAALWLPTSGVRQRLLAAKRAELARLHRALRGDREALRGLAVGRRAPEPGLADLLAYERFLQRLPTTPFEQGSWIRFGLYLALPLGSWLGGAFAERLLAALLD